MMNFLKSSLSMGGLMYRLLKLSSTYCPSVTVPGLAAQFCPPNFARAKLLGKIGLFQVKFEKARAFSKIFKKMHSSIPSFLE